VSPHFEAWVASFEDPEEAPLIRRQSGRQPIPVLAAHPGYSSAVREAPSGGVRFRGEGLRTRQDVEMIQLDVVWLSFALDIMPLLRLSGFSSPAGSLP
jgi:hypothetical protein